MMASSCCLDADAYWAEVGCPQSRQFANVVAFDRAGKSTVGVRDTFRTTSCVYCHSHVFEMDRRTRHHMLRIETLHHVSLPIRDLAVAKAFYSGILELAEIERPAFNFPGAWYAVGDRVLHLIVEEKSTFRTGKGIDS